ncbi:J domain-containing protein [Variovorax paradoxus]|nr:J domain-containing protein [Variovorax paradoxus]MBT2303170.1 J domain-containing protein [Variovorax paradoxus]
MSDPYRQLGVPQTADDDTIRAAYLAAIRACPPERDRQRFEQVRAAFEAIASERQRLAHALFDTSAPTAREVLELLSAGWKTDTPTEASLYQLLGRHD